MFKFVSILVTLISFSLVDSFLTPPSTVGHNKITTTTNSQLWMSSTSTPPPSRRDVLKTAGVSVATVAASWLIDPTRTQAFGSPITAQSAANKANESYQGVYFDPRHPNGYRVLMAVKGDSNKARMTVSDGVSKDSNEEPKTFREIPVSVDNGNELLFDFGFKNGPKNIKGTLSADKQSITFEDGNTWTKNYYKYDGIYKVTSGGDPSLSQDAYRVIRKNGPEILVEVNDTGNSKDSYNIDASCETLMSIPTSSITFYFGGKNAPSPEVSFLDQLENLQRGGDGNVTRDTPTKVGQFSLQDRNTVFPYGSITFPDKTVWTRI